MNFNLILLISDLHMTRAKELKEFVDQLNSFPEVLHISLGDLTFSSYDPINLDPLLELKHDNFKLIGGNHDDYDYLEKNKPSYYLGNYGMINSKIGFVRGAESKVDYYSRKNYFGSRFFKEEELSDDQLQKMVNFFSKEKPEIILSHEAPESINKILYPSSRFSVSRTELYLEKLIQLGSIKSWYFGHHHKAFKANHKFINFTCLEIGTALELPI